MKEFSESQRRKSYALIMSWHSVTCTITNRKPRLTKDKILPTIQDNGPIALTYYLIISQVRNYTLVSDDGVIRPEIFYKALTLWVDRDVLGYAFSQVC